MSGREKALGGIHPHQRGHVATPKLKTCCVTLQWQIHQQQVSRSFLKMLISSTATSSDQSVTAIIHQSAFI